MLGKNVYLSFHDHLGSEIGGERNRNSSFIPLAKVSSLPETACVTGLQSWKRWGSSLAHMAHKGGLTRLGVSGQGAGLQHLPLSRALAGGGWGLGEVSAVSAWTWALWCPMNVCYIHYNTNSLSTLLCPLVKHFVWLYMCVCERDITFVCIFYYTWVVLPPL